MIDKIDSICDMLYQENIQDAYVKLQELIKELMLSLAKLNEEEQVDMVKVLKPALEAMEANDTTLLADILQYEVKDRIEKYI